MAVLLRHCAVLLILSTSLLDRSLAATLPRRTNHGLIGYGIVMYDPPCAYACKDVVSPSPLNCSDHSAHGGGGHGGHSAAQTSPACYATDDAFLRTMAWCLERNCPDAPRWKLEYFWSRDLVGRSDNLPKPKETFQQALARITEPPTETMVAGDPLNQTSLVPEEDYTTNYVTLRDFADTERMHSRYGLVVLLTISLLPVALSLLRFAPIPKHIVSRVNAFLIYPAVWGKRHSQPLPYKTGIAPTRGQALFIGYVIVINVIFSGVGIYFTSPSAWMPDDASAGVRSYVANRVGVLSFVNLALVFLFAGRNNVLLWVTDWSYSTFLLLHRWISYVAILQAILHSVLWLEIYVNALGTHSTESKLPYWYWGIIATLSMSLLLPLSLLPVRQKLYELFLAWHVILSVLTLVGCYLHIWCLFKRMWGYETWIYPSIAFWVFDRLVRLLRLARNGIKTATVTTIDDDYIRVDVAGVAANGHAYLYFPTLTWRVWENHPFSVASMVQPVAGSARLADASSPRVSSSDNSQPPTEKTPYRDFHEEHDTERNGQNGLAPRKPTIGLTFFIRNHAGITSLLRSRQSLPVLVESPYGHHPDLSSYPSLIAIVGGVGITSVLPALRSHVGDSKLYWGVRRIGIVEALRPNLIGIRKEVAIGERLALRDILEREVAAAEGDVAVIVSGPAGMADDVRAIVSEIGRRSDGQKRRIEFVEESFTW